MGNITHFNLKNIQFSITVFTLLISCTITTNCFSQKTNPPGTIFLKDNLFIDIVPTCNVYYREYEYFMRQFAKFDLDSLIKIADSASHHGSNVFRYIDSSIKTPKADSLKYLVNQADSLTWSNSVNYKTYMYNPAYNYYPMVNVPYDIAVRYIKWRTLMVQLLYSIEPSIKVREKRYKKVKYRLATKEEWEYALAKFKSEGKFSELKPKSGETVPKIKWHKQNFILAPLSEIVAERNIVKGCNWKQTNCKDNVNATFESHAPSDWITFRCVCEVEE